jgi:streptogramin lyase
MRARRALLALLALLPPLALGCSERARLNPFDPRNPTTGGRPQGFVALAGNGQITLRWNPSVAPDLIGYALQRKGPGDTAFVAYGTLSARADSLIDFLLQNRRDYEYRIAYEFTRGVSPHFSADLAQPAPVHPWVVDAGSGALLRMTADGRRVGRRLAGFYAPNRAALDRRNGRIWLSDTFGGALVLFGSDGSLIRRIPDFAQPGAIAVDPVDGTIWVCDEARNEVEHVDELGLPVGLTSLIPDVRGPFGIAVDPNDRSVWICEHGRDQLRKVDRDGSPLYLIPLATPARVAVDSSTREAWVTDFDGGRLVRLSPTGTVLSTLAGLPGPLGVAVDHRRGLVWVALARGNSVVAYRSDLSEAARVNGISAPRHLSLDLAVGEAWVVAGGSGELWRIALDGSVVMRSGGFSAPVDVVVDPGR